MLMNAILLIKVTNSNKIGIKFQSHQLSAAVLTFELRNCYESGKRSPAPPCLRPYC